MSKSVFMQLQMEAGLRASFQEVAERQHRPAAQVLRQLMREYVAMQCDAEAVAMGRRLEAVRRAAGYAGGGRGAFGGGAGAFER